MKKNLLTTTFAIIVFLANAQLKVNPTGQISIGGTFAPLSQLDISGQTILRDVNKNVLTINSPGTNYGHFYTDGSNNNLYLGGSPAVTTVPTGPIMTWGLSTNNVGIGAALPLSKLSVGGSGNSLFQGYFYNSNPLNGACGIMGEIAGTTGGARTICGVRGLVRPVSTSGGNSFPIGVDGQSIATATATGNFAIGVRGLAQNGAYNFGVMGALIGGGNGASILGAAPGSLGYPFIAGQYAGYFNGKLRTTDDNPEKPSGGSWSTPSDGRVKKDVKDFKDGLAVIRKIKPVNYNYNGIGGFPSEKTNVGIIAQEVQKVAPYCVGKSKIVIKDNEKAAFSKDIIETIQDSTGGNLYIAEALNFNQDGLFWAMLNSIKELDSTVTELQKQIKENKPEENTGEGKSETTLQVALANNNQAILYQNVPNPFDGSTVIRYFIPENTIGNAYVTFYDMYGKEVNKLEIKEKGFGKIEADTENLANGIYSYSIIINDKIIDTKKMLKSK